MRRNDEHRLRGPFRGRPIHLAWLALAGLVASPAPVCAQDAPASLPGDVPFGTARTIRNQPPSGAPSADAIAQDVLLPATPDPALITAPLLRGRTIVTDGDLTYPPEPQAPQDGLVAIPTQDTPAADSGSPATVDQRNAADIAAFENPPAGYNPQLFQIEDLDITADRRVRELFASPGEPYDPVGIRVGTFIFFPEFEIGGRFQSNVLSAAEDTPDSAVVLAPSARIVSNWSNHALELRGALDISRHGEHESEDDNGYLIEGRGRLDILRSTNAQGLISRQRAQESRTAVDASTVGPRTTVTTDRGEGSFNHRFNRLSIQLRGGLTSESYGYDTDVVNGGSNPSDRDNVERDIALRASWEFKPTFSVFGEVEGNHRDFSQLATSDGLSRNSAGTRYRSGVSFGQTGAYLRGEVALGYGRQDLDEPALEDVDGMIFDASLAWRATGLTTVLFNAQTGFTNSTTAGTGGVLERRYDVGLRHTFRPQLIGETGVAVTNRSFAGIGVDEREVVWNLGLEYYLRREAVVFGSFEHTVFRSDFPDQDFQDNELRIGLRLRR